MSGLVTYRRVLGTPGAALFSGTGLLGRMPMSMMTLGIVLLVTGTASGSYTLAGQVSAAFVIANAILSAPQGRLLDRLGQRPVLLVDAVVFALGCGLLAVAVRDGWPTPLPHVAAALAGATMPPVGNAVRARWSHVLGEKQQVDTAFAVEAVVDEMVFMAGPAIATFLATTIDPVAGVVSAAALGVVGTVALAAQRRTDPPPLPLSAIRAERPRMPWLRIVALVVVSACLGSFFGAAEVATVGFTDEAGVKSAAGILLALWALGSLVSGVLTGAITWRVSTLTRIRVGVPVLAALMAPAVLLTSVPALGALLLVAGFAISPSMIAVFSLAGEIAPKERLAEALGLVQMGIGAGIAPGAAFAGVVVDAHGGAPAFAVAVGSGLLAAVVAWLPILRS